MTAARPRTAVIDDAWRATVADLADVTVLSGRDGRPLARTVKCVIDPLVLRLRANPELGKPLLDGDNAARVTDLIAAVAPTLADCARWFVELKAQRRTARITGGNIQEQYFPRAFELAVSYGPPGADAAAIAAETIIEIHQPSAGMSIDDLAEYLSANKIELEAALARVWSEAADVETASQSAEVGDAVGVLLDDTASDTERAARWSALATSATPGRVGSAVFSDTAALDRLLTSCAVEVAGPAPTLSAVTPVGRPTLLGRHGGLPLDRSIAARLTTTLRRSRDREELPPLGELVDDEIIRSREPWALDGPVWHCALLVGVVVAAQLHPLDPQPSSHSFVDAMSERLAAQAHIMYNRRFLLTADAPDSALSADLREFWRPYLSRLWVRLHGRSVTEPSCTPRQFDAEMLLDLLDGIARSVSYDQRSRIRATIEKAGR